MKPGNIAKVRISGELVFITDRTKWFGKAVITRRAVTTRDGLEYLYEEFQPNELETPEAAIDREFEEAMYRTKLMKHAIEAEEAMGNAMPAPVQ